MRGLTQGEQSSTTNPVLQLFTRQAGFLTDIYSGTFRIEDVRTSGAAIVVKVATTSFVTGTHKLGTGRYLIPTGATTAWSVGTHRAVCQYQMAAAGPTYTQVIEFEVLDPIDWPVGTAYIGYLSTRQALGDSFVASTVTRQALHRLISEASYSIEMWTKRWFEPRYVSLSVEGRESEILLLRSPIVAIEDIYAIWQTTDGTDSYKFDQYLYKVYNRHLNGGAQEADDRRHPKLVLTYASGTLAYLANFAFPYGNQNLQVTGVFGYTDPDPDPNNGQVLIGHTPYDLARACGGIIARRSRDASMSSPSTTMPGAITSMRTRHQSISFGSSGGSSGIVGGSSDLTGDPAIDAIILRYAKPSAFMAV
jgi:hypothetical protein